MMDIFDELEAPEVRALRNRYHELFGRWIGYSWTRYGSVEEYKADIQKRIAEKEKELGL